MAVMSSTARTGGNSSPWIRKPLEVVHRQERNTQLGEGHHQDNNQLHRHLSVWDLIGIGVGGTVGSGIFVLTGQIASQYAGQACWLSWTIAGIAACLSGTCYAELSGRIPVAGSTYVYSYICLGEVAAVIAAACLTLEYGVSGAAVARTWGDKVLHWLQFNSWWLRPNGVVNIPAFFVSAGSTILLLAGVQESKRVLNTITIMKVLIVAFMIVGGFFLYSPSRIKDQSWTPSGVPGVLRGATTSFFGYLGYDEVCCVAGEAANPARDLPRAVLGTLVTVTVLYISAAIALTGMLPYADISPTAGFPDAFQQRGWTLASQITATGEVLTLPVVVVISLLAQPRLLLGMASDGLLPPIFGKVHRGNLTGGTLISGVVMTITATFVPFTYLDDLISAGILVAFCMTNSCLVLFRCASPIHQQHLLENLLALYNALCFTTALLWTHQWSFIPFQTFSAVLSMIATAATFCWIAIKCPTTGTFGGSVLHHTSGDPTVYFQTPCVPFLPCLGIAVNWYLIAQLEWTGLLMLCLYLGLAVVAYLWYGAPNSVGHNRNWMDTSAYDTVQAEGSSTVAEHDPLRSENMGDVGKNPAVRSSSM